MLQTHQFWYPVYANMSQYSTFVTTKIVYSYLGKSDTLNPNRDPCVTISSVWVHKWVWMLTFVSLLFLAISISIFTILKYYFYTIHNIIIICYFVPLTYSLCLTHLLKKKLHSLAHWILPHVCDLFKNPYSTDG